MKLRFNKTLRLTLLFPFAFSISGCKQYEPKTLDPDVNYDNVYLIMGQSNASGVSEYQYLETSNPEIYQRYMEGNSKVLISYNTSAQKETNFVPTKFGFGHTEQYFGPEIGIAEYISQVEEHAYIIKGTEGGTCLQTQYVNARGKKLKLYNQYVGFIKQQLEVLVSQGKNPRVRGVFWMQGESDTFLSYADKYQKAQQHFFEYLRLDLNDYIYDHFNFVDAYIFTRGICWVNPEVINDCKQRFADENDHCYCIKTNGEDENAIYLTLKCETGEEDDLAHYDSKSMLLLGMTAGEYLVK